MKFVLLGEGFANLFAYSFNGPQVELAIAEAGCTHTDEGNFGVGDCLMNISSCAQQTTLLALSYQLVQVWLKDWAATGIQHLNLTRVAVYTHHLVALGHQTGRGY